MGSVKDLVVLREPQNDKAGVGRFIFSDRYSVFDWGEMPDHITGKGKAICIATAYFFEKLETLGIKTHYRGIVENNKSLKLNELHTAQNIMEISLLRVLKPEIRDKKYIIKKPAEQLRGMQFTCKKCNTLIKCSQFI